MSRPKLSCDWERPRCTHLATQTVHATNGEKEHTSQYCDEHHATILQITPPAGWTITTTWAKDPESPKNQTPHPDRTTAIKVSSNG